MNPSERAPTVAPLQQQAEQSGLSAASLETLFVMVRDAVLVHDLRGIPIRVNQAVISTYGFDPTGMAAEEISRRLQATLLDEMQISSEDYPLQRALRGQEVRDFGVKIVNLQGKTVLLSVSITPIRNAAGEVIGAVSTFQDITERRKAEEKQRELSRLIDLCYEPIFSWELDRGILTWNQGCEQLYGYTREEALGHCSHELLRTQFPISLDDLRAHLLQDGSWAGELQHQTKDGRVVTIESRQQLMETRGQKVVLETNRDITERKQIENALRQSEATLEAFFANSPGILNIADEELRYIKTDTLTPTYYGLDRQSILGKALKDLGPEFFASYSPMMRRILATGQPELNLEVQAPMPFREGDTAYWLASYFPIPLPDGKRGLGVMGVEITKQRKAEQALRESEERFRLALKNSPIVVYTNDRNLRYTWIYNPALGYDPAQIIGKTDEELNTPENVAELVALKRAVLESGIGKRQEIHFHYQDQDFFYDTSAEPIRTENGEVAGLMVAAVDVTDKKHSDQARLSDQIRIELQRRLLDQREQERLEIARELHDGPVQELIGVIFLLKELMDDFHLEIVPQLQSIHDLVQSQIVELRDYAGELRPPILVSFGLGKAIRSHLETFRKKYPAIGVHFEEKQEGKLLDDEVRLALFRIYQETLTNIIKHSQASEVQIRFFKNPRQAVLEIEDNGIGFDVPRDWLELARHKHLGLVGTRERAEAIGGQVEIRSKPGKGTSLKVTVPLHEAD